MLLRSAVSIFYRNFKKSKFRCDTVPNRRISTENIRNIGIVAHIDAGKTTTTERMLYYSGFIRSMGEVHEGDTVMDYMPQERERGITISSAAITFPWKKHDINLIDTPGHVDFTIEVERALCALDGAVVILDSSAGVEVQTLTVWNQAKRYDIPCIAYLNKMDKPGADHEMSVESLKQKLRVKPLVLQVPVGVGRNFRGVVDLIHMRKLIWDNTGVNRDGSAYASHDLDLKDSDKLVSVVKKQREELVETVADLDDEYGSRYILDGQDALNQMDLIKAIRRITLKRNAIPVLCGSSYKNIGIQPLLDSVILYLPNPSERTNHIKTDSGGVHALVFKITHDKIRGPLTFIRTYSGCLESGQKIHNVNRKKSEKITNLMVPLANELKDVSSLSAGRIAVIAGLKDVVTGDTLVSGSSIKKSEGGPDEHGRYNMILQVPDPVFFCTIEPPSLAAQSKLELALQCLEKEDPTFRVKYDEEMGQTVISGMGELHIEVIARRILEEYGIKPYLGPLQVAYRESIARETVHEYVLSKTLGGNKNFVKINLSLFPSRSRGTKFKEVKVVVTDENGLGKIRQDHLKAVNAGISSAIQNGPILGFPVIDILVDLHWLEVSRSTTLPMVTAAASQCLHEMLNRVCSILQEPVMRLCITIEKGYAGTVLGDLSQRRSQILDMEVLGDVEVIHARTPLSELKGYSTALRALASGRCTFTMEFDNYEPMEAEQQARAISGL